MNIAVADIAVPVRIDMPLPFDGRGGLAPWQRKRVLRFILDNTSARIAIGSLAGIARLSTGHFSRAFRVSFGVSPRTMVCTCRVDRARQLLLATNLSLADVASACGFSDQSHLSRLFRRHVGVPPGHWRHLARLAGRAGDALP